jgi:pilus assembly protein Flp/PilA
MKTKNMSKKQKGASLVEYALLVSLIALVAIVGVKAVGTAANTQFSSQAQQLG